ncbi:hypothetical protein RBB78_03715 [Tunturiibacter empetritectus]|uniref:hypothetical protein n=1 Tax=Tunturiibacter empetritectus TaxID=3069691 RepID=UPI003D9B878F
MTRISIMRTITQANTPSLSGLLGLALAFTSVGHALAQVQTDQQTQTAPQVQAAQPAPQPAPQSTDISQPAPDQGQISPSLVETKAAPSPTTPLPAAPAVKDKKGKQEYTGPNTVVELPPTPMLDAEGKQQQDPDGKLMFNPPIRQQRDKRDTRSSTHRTSPSCRPRASSDTTRTARSCTPRKRSHLKQSRFRSVAAP